MRSDRPVVAGRRGRAVRGDRRRWRLPARALLAAGLAGPGSAGCGDAPEPGRPTLSVAETLGGADTAGYARALAPRPFEFPADRGPHPDFRTEWWYVTGNLAGSDGRRLGFQLTFFRLALAPGRPTSGSAWATHQAYLAHLAVTDAPSGEHHAFERVARGAAGLAGAVAEPFRVWLDDWSLGARAGAPFPLRLVAGEGDVSLDLTLDAGKPPVLHGERGLSRKGPEPGNASYYYSRTRMAARGTVRIGGRETWAQGTAWLDREWSTSSLPAGVVGWDWFALQMAGGWELMAYRLRGVDGTAAPESAGTLVDPAGRARHLAWGSDVSVEETERWTSPVDGAAYPSGWRIRLPAEGWDLEVRPLVEDQEVDLTFRYWEGAVGVTGRVGDRPAEGWGYAELTGYAGRRLER